MDRGTRTTIAAKREHVDRGLDSLEVLGEIGQDITASLEFEDIFAAIERHVGSLLDTSTLYIGLLDETREWIEVPLFVDGGKRGRSRKFRLDDPVRPAAHCIRENREIFREKTQEQARREDIPGTALTLSTLFRPLCVHGNTFGVMSVQSRRAHAYGERERLIFKTLCSYAAVALANAESHRRLAAIRPLEALGAIAQEITATLEVDEIFAAVERHLGELSGASTYCIGLLDVQDRIAFPLFVVRGERIRVPKIRLDEVDHPVAAAARVSLEILQEGRLLDPADAPPADSGIVGATLFHPLSVKGRTLGLVAIQSERVAGFDERQLLIVRTLGSYIAIALANADAYGQAQTARREATTALADLRQAQESLIKAQTMASLGQLVAGVAHEVNTPVGTAYTIASTLHRRAEDFRQQAGGATLRRSDLSAFLEVVTDATTQLDANLLRATDLVTRFKEVAADRTSDERRTFDLAELIATILASLRAQLRGTPHEVVVEAPAGLVLDSYPGALGQILINLILNASLHAFPEGRAGTINLSVTPRAGGFAEISVTDDGVGISSADQSHIFEPFYTTRRGRGGTGLGLHIASNLATKTLKGKLTHEPTTGRGTLFRLVIPTDVSERGR